MSINKKLLLSFTMAGIISFKEIFSLRDGGFAKAFQALSWEVAVRRG